MKILYIAPLSSTHSYKWIQYFKNKEYQVYCIGVENKDNLYVDGVEYFLSKKRKSSILTIFSYIFFTIKIIKRLDFDVLHLHFIGKNAIPLLFIRKIKNFVVSVWGSDVLVLPKKNVLIKQAVKNIISKANIITYDGSNMYKELLTYTDKDKLVEIGFGLDTKKLHCDQKREIKDKVKIVSLRNLEDIYSIDTIIEAANLLVKDNIKNFEINIYGTGSKLEYLQSLVKKYGLDGYIKFKGKYKYSNLKEILCSSDVYISSSLSDSGIATSTMEAMSAGLPIITTNVGDNKLYIKDNYNGFLFDTKDFNKLFKVLKTLLLDPNKINILGERNIEIAQKFDINYNMEKMDKIYKSLIK